MKYDLKTPCKNCPFRNDKTRIVFACRKRAEEIERQAYYNGFPCHLSADLIEGNEYGEDGFVEGEGTQHCVGYIIMMFHEGQSYWPGIGNNEKLVTLLRDKMDWKDAPVFRCSDDFFDANEKGS